MDALQLSILAVGGLVAGVINTLAGGGWLLTVGLLVFLGVPGTIANGTNRVAIVVQSLASTWTFQRSGQTETRLVLRLAPATIVGALLAPRLSYIESSIAFSPMLSFIVVITALLGGAHRLWGPIVGVIPFMLAWDFLTATFPNQTTLMLGICFLHFWR